MPRRFRKINKVLAWFSALPDQGSAFGLYALSVYASVTDSRFYWDYGTFETFRWERFKRAVEFITHHIDQRPNFELLHDYMKGAVGFDGRGRLG